MTSWPLLGVITFLPLAGALFIAFLSDDEEGVRNARWVALWTTLIVFAISLILLRRFDATSPDFQFVEHWASVWRQRPPIRFLWASTAFRCRL